VLVSAITIGALLAAAIVRSDQSSAARPDPSAAPIEVADATTSTTLPPPTSNPIHVEDGRVVVVGTQRFTAGEPGDRVAVGDWDCNGTPTVAVLRPSTGAVFVFDEWATARSDISVPATTRAPGAVDLQTRTRDDGCSALVAVRPDGTEQEVQ
jgi:hypothetical protein